MDFAELLPADPNGFPFIAYIQTSFPNPTMGAGGLEIGTGTLIAPCVVLTAGHIVFDPNQGGQAESISVTFGDPQRQTFTAITHVDFPTEWRDAANGSLDSSVVSPVDIGVIILPEPIDSQITPVPFQTASDSMLAGMSLNVSGYPANPPEGARGTSLWGRNFALLDGSTLPSELTQYQSFRLFYPVQTLPGLSGGPVYDFDPVSKIRTLRGIHTSGPTADSPSFPGSALRITEGIFSLIQHWITTYRP